MRIDRKPTHVEARRDDVRIRVAPDDRALKLGCMYRRDRVTWQGERVKRRRVTWYRVAYNDGQGWVSGRYSKLVTSEIGGGER